MRSPAKDPVASSEAGAAAAPGEPAAPRLDPEAIAASVRAARKARGNGDGQRRKVSRPFRDAVKADRRLSKAAHRMAKAAAKGFGTYREEQDASARKKRDGAVRDAPLNAAKGMADAMAEASRVPVDLMRAMNTRTGVRVIRRTARMVLKPLG
jgi:hypothetical protein